MLAGDRTARLPRGTWALDPARTTVRAGVRKLLVVDAPAVLSVIGGSVDIDARGLVTGVEAVLDARSYDSDNDKRDAWATGPACLDADRHPNLAFRSRDVRVGPTGAVAVGTVTVKGVDTPVMIDVAGVEIDGDTATFRASVVIDRKAVGLGAFPSFLIARMIPLTIEATATRVTVPAELAS